MPKARTFLSLFTPKKTLIAFTYRQDQAEPGKGQGHRGPAGSQEGWQGAGRTKAQDCAEGVVGFSEEKDTTFCESSPLRHSLRPAKPSLERSGRTLAATSNLHLGSCVNCPDRRHLQPHRRGQLCLRGPIRRRTYHQRFFRSCFRP